MRWKSYRRISRYLLLLLLPAISATHAQTDRSANNEVPVSGTVKDKLGAPIAGVSITVFGKSGRGSSSDEQGRFTIQASAKATLVFSHINYTEQSVPVNNTIVLDVVMEAREGNQNEVVVVGYGKSKRISLVGAQTSVNVAELKQPVANISTMLAGRIAGIVGVQRTGEPGMDGADIWIRGITTFNGNNNAKPLVLIDGIERDINSLDPEDIESFSILKDASATAVYGVRGANGVILMKTKSGKAGKPSFTVNYNQGITSFTKAPELADGITYMQLTNEAMLASGQTPKYSQDYIDKTAAGTDPYVYPNVDWMDEVFNKTGENRRFNASARGGSANANYYVSVAYYDEKGFLKTDGLSSYDAGGRFKRYNFTSNLNLTLTPTTKFELGVQGYITNTNHPAISSQDAFIQAMQITPVSYPVMYPGNFVPGQSSNGDQRNPYADVTQRGFWTIANNQLYTNGRLTQQLDFITKGLSATVLYSFDAYRSNTLSRSRRRSTYYVDANNPRLPDGSLNLIRTWVGSDELGYSNSNISNHRYYTESSINYDRDFGPHHVGAMLLYNQNDYTYESAGDLVGSLPYRSRGLAGRTTYSLHNRYFIEGNFGYNGSENFAPEARSGFFPSIGIGWVASSEKFFEPIKNAISFLKFRYSDGLVGANSSVNEQSNVTRFLYQTWVTNGPGYSFGLNWNDARNGIAIANYGVDVTWSESRKQDLGIEIKTLNDKLSLTVDFFKEHRTGIFIGRGGVAGFAGIATAIYGNLGVVDNRGIDATLETNPLRVGNTYWNFRGSFTYNKDKVIENDQPAQKFPYMDRRGQNLLSVYGLTAIGLFESQDEINKSPQQSFGAPRVGDIKYADWNGDNVIDNFDAHRIGNGDVPNMVYGFGFNTTWKNFNFGVFFQGTSGADRIISGDGIIPFNNSTGADRSNLYAIATDRWTVDNPRQDAFYPRLAYGNTANVNNAQTSTWWLKDIDFIRLKTLDLGYSFPKKILPKWGVKNVRAYVNAVNLLTFSKFKLWDPELNTSNGTRYPNVRTISLGLIVNLQ
ncbi:SusC/RagA family TonB-linked outer membrane protein [Niastella populi]|uniref:SusC/RagA family TonB-linked outer membrane protein n=1 Tax=Niastella populi TaxID=550983 RepID=A0A1V9FHL5_9BACT|nr:TonB-dependent receptor [Niastella populi]OQP57869.1 SusC/RagA family TonB-linked outer membrane protein [Niastella populi]